jgi:hypothetical protein
MKVMKMVCVLAALVALTGMQAQGTVIYPNDDCSTRGSTLYNATSPFGLLVKNSSDVAWVEFDLGETPAELARLVLHNDDTGVTNPWEITVKGAEFNIDTASFTGTNVSDWENVGSIPGVLAVDFYSLDVTDFYNSHLGQTVTLQLGRASQPSGSGPIFEDIEGTKTGDGLTYGPRLEVTPVPEPSCVVMMLVGAAYVYRRRVHR